MKPRILSSPEFSEGHIEGCRVSSYQHPCYQYSNSHFARFELTNPNQIYSPHINKILIALKTLLNQS
jgi:hypothetical protein